MGEGRCSPGAEAGNGTMTRARSRPISPLGGPTRVCPRRTFPFVLALVAVACGPDDDPPFVVEDDQVAPSAVLDLRVSARDDSVLTLLWTSPGDDGTEGRAWRYDVRRSDAPIDETNWAAATRINGEPVPSFAERTEIFLLLGLGVIDHIYFALRTEDEWGNVSALSNVAQAFPLDRTPPGRVADLSAALDGPDGVILSWTATGDDGDAGRANGYVIRWADTELGEANFDDGTLVSPSPVPRVAGEAESFRLVVGTDAPRSYWFALEVWDEVSQVGPLSNVVRVDRPGHPAPRSVP